LIADLTSLADSFVKGKVLLFDKPLFWTSFDLVNKVKFLLKSQLGLKKVKVGHSGTLDPLATGLLVVCTGKETRNIILYQSDEKEYLARITLGFTTPSFDLETDPDALFPTGHIGELQIQEVLRSFGSGYLQIPPAHSARMVKGVRSYKRARRGESLLPASSWVDLPAIDLVGYMAPVLNIRVVCSKGTYMRSLANDIGLRLGTGACLTGLIRTRSGKFRLDDAMRIQEFERNLLPL